jgi:hypothetical protein
MTHDELLAEFKILQDKVEAIEKEIRAKTDVIIADKNVALLIELGNSLEKLRSPAFGAGMKMLDTAKIINETPIEDEKAKMVSLGKELKKQLEGIYKAEGFVSFESELSVNKRCVVLNVQFGDKEVSDERGTYSRPEFEGNIIIKKTGIEIEEYENTPDGINNRGSDHLSEISVNAVLKYFENFDLSKKESYLDQ